MYNILVCDDERDIVSALNIYLSSENYGVFSAYSGQEMLQIMDTETVDLVLLDVMMPGMDGITALKKLREKHNVR
jgi:DNA-binding response OmpR family regulator